MQPSNLVHIIDDDEAVRHSLAFLLNTARLEVRTYESATAFLSALPSVTSGCIVTDVRMPEVSGVDLLRRLKELKIGMPVIVITGHGDVQLAVEAMKIGAVDFIEKPFDDVRLYDSVKNALRTDRELVAKGEALNALRARIAELSDRQREVMELLIDGLSNKEIGKRLGISPRTVETYRAFVMAKTGAHSLAELVKMSIRVGMRT